MVVVVVVVVFFFFFRSFKLLWLAILDDQNLSRWHILYYKVAINVNLDHHFLLRVSDNLIGRKYNYWYTH